MFRINKESEKLDLYGVWNPKEIYGNEYVIAPLTSIYKDTQYLECGTKVQNVEGSTGDPNPYGSNWIGVIKLVYAVKGYKENTDICCLDNNYYNFANNESHILTSHGNNNIYGGHMIIAGDKSNNTLKPGSFFYLMHICSGHNKHDCKNDYFKTGMATYAVVMSDFLQEEQIPKAILAFAATLKSNEDVEFDVQKYCNENKIELKRMLFE